MEKSGQIEMKFAYTYDVKEMGRLIFPNTIYLYDSFIRDKLNPGSLDVELRKKGEITNIGCPFCKNGFLKLSKVERKYSGDPRSILHTLHHSGNHYEYVCSNPDCSWRFVGTCTWLYID